MASYLYALTSGELVCARAITEQLFSGAILAADALIVIVALAWLLPAYDRNKHGEVRFFRGLIQVTAQFSMLMVVVSADGFNNSVLHQHVAQWGTALVYGGGAAFMLAILLFWWKPLPSPQHRHRPTRCPMESPPPGGLHTGATRSISTVAYRSRQGLP